MSDERRAHPRAPGALEGSWSGSVRRCRVTSLSLSGCFIETMALPQPGSRVSVELHVLDQESIPIEGEVVDSDQGMGFSMRFGDLTPETRERLTRVVDTLFRAHDLP